MQVLVPKIPCPTATSHHPAPCQTLQGLQQAAVMLEKAKTLQLAQQHWRGVDGAEQPLSPLPVFSALPHSFSYSNTSCFFWVKSDELFSPFTCPGKAELITLNEHLWQVSTLTARSQAGGNCSVPLPRQGQKLATGFVVPALLLMHKACLL